MDFLNTHNFSELVTATAEKMPVYLTPEVKWAARSIAFNPFYWNLVGRIENKSHFLTKIFGGSKHKACYLFAFSVFTLGLLRDYLFYEALQSQPTAPLLNTDLAKLLGVLVAGTGHVFVLSSMWALGITGTYLGDYFGILMDHKVECFPFNVVANPMYTGSYMTFLGVALYEGKAIGVALSFLVWIIYRIGLFLEEPFTEKIYSEKAKLE